ncbi:hypothetical protein E2I00_009677, partial [Balaenoptera physalus]
METAPAKGKKAPAKAAPAKAKGTAEDEEEDEEDEEDDEEEEEEEEEEPVKEAPGKRKKEMTKQKQLLKPRNRNLFVGNLNFSTSSPELKTGISDLFAKNDLAVVDVRIGVSRKFGYVDFESAEDLGKALELTGLKEELKEVFEDAVEIRLVSKDGKSKGIAYIEFKTETDSEKNLEEKQGTEIDGRSISLYYTREKGQSQDYRGGENSTWSGESKTLVLSNLSYSATEETLQEAFEKATFIKVPQNQNGKSKGYAFIEFASFEDAKEALNSCNKMEIEGRAIRLELQEPRGSPNARSQPEEETKAAKEAMEDGEVDGNKVNLDWAKPKGEGGFGGQGGGRGGRGGSGGRGWGGFG